ncbi:MAG: peptide deformylase [Polyangia bacterium]
MALRKILKFPDPVLRQPTHAVPEEAIVSDPSIRQLVADMAETMYAKNGAGLAAIQVGSPLRLFIVEPTVGGHGENDPPVVFINPVIEWLSSETESTDEGCLSFPGIYVPVKRALKCRTRAWGVDGKPFIAEGEGLYARAMQHELDHLDNRLLIDFAGPVKRQMIKRRLEKMTDEEADELQAQGE